MKVIEAKIVVLGSQGVGKTSLVVRYIGKMFSKHISPTIGASFFTCNINVGDARVKLQVWDTAGQERFRSMAPMYYRNANAALLVFDITSVTSFAAIKSWVKELQSNVPENMVLSVVGNKCDLDESRAVSRSEATQYAASIGAHYCETSALHDQGIDQVFLSTATELLEMSESNSMSSMRSYDSSDGESARLPVGSPSEEAATHTGKVELPAWSVDSIAHGELQKNMCC
ncbi:ras-related protein Rab-31 isoform X1 [Amyelois transitella]|uniref:ras-related protein Rab-31 isoform X1 n=1 Tax=Amyelois transitella TaxID=680683 RepID=UPI00298FC744|nr:ras-related protein Rab-31 isoform X1 [Amyelois transitella]